MVMGSPAIASCYAADPNCISSGASCWQTRCAANGQAKNYPSETEQPSSETEQPF